MKNINDDTIAIYIIFDDILSGIGRREHKLRKTGDSEVLTTVAVACLYFNCNISKSIAYMKCHHCPDMIGESRFNRRWHALEKTAQECFLLLSLLFKQEAQRKLFTLDTMPVAVCRNIRISRCKLLQGEDYRGWNASKREWFYGFKLAVLADGDGIPVEIAFIPGTYSEQSALKRLDFYLPEGSLVYGDSGFTNYEWEDFWKEEEGIEFLIARKKGSKRGDTLFEAAAKEANRKPIETSFSQINAMLPKKIHAVTLQGFLYKVWFCTVTFAVQKYFL